MYSSLTFINTESGLVRASLAENSIFKLPKNVNQFLASEVEIRGKVAEATRKEKQDALEKIAKIREGVERELDELSRRVEHYYDAYSANFDQNMKEFKTKCAGYKSVEWFGERSGS